MRRIITYGGYFEAFIETLSEDVVKKIDYGLALLSRPERAPAKFVEYIEDGIYELRTEWEGNIYRVFFIFDKGNVVVLFNGFQKKAQKTPRKEINKAKRIKQEYYESQKR
jgi:phage-related protein